MALVPVQPTSGQAAGPESERDQDDVDAVCPEQEVLRLRDELVGLQAELGQAQGRVAELEALLQRYENLRQRYEAMVASRSWRMTQALGTPLRKLRERRGR